MMFVNNVDLFRCAIILIFGGEIFLEFFIQLTTVQLKGTLVELISAKLPVRTMFSNRN
jgi:hypothetical protein